MKEVAEGIKNVNDVFNVTDVSNFKTKGSLLLYPSWARRQDLVSYKNSRDVFI